MQNMFDADSGAPVIAILRGIVPSEILPVFDALLSAGVNKIEIPLNSPDPFDSISTAVSEFGSDALIGAGTVMSKDQVKHLVDLGARLIVSPNTDSEVIIEAARSNLATFPGAMTPTEIFSAQKAGATGAKLFPARGLGLGFVGDLKSVLPKGFPLVAVGGIDASNIRNWLAAGADGVGVGSSIFRPGDSPNEVYEKATALVQAIKEN